jgi:purine-cytosine permease-like protein
MSTPAAPAQDRIGRIEEAGVEFIPDAARDSSPANLLAVFLGANLGFTIVIFGWLPIVFGLGFWSALSSTTLGLAMGTLAILPIALIGPRTGTNVTVSSGAHFGIRGRFIGSALTLCLALAFAAITVWTSGDALVGAAHRLAGTPDGDAALAVGYALIAAGMVAVALYGHATIVAIQKLVVPLVSVLLVLGVVAFAADFDVGYSGGEYLLGGFWQTWTLSVVLAAAGPLSYAPNIGDYTRRISRRRHGDRSVAAAIGAGLFVGQLLPAVFGMLTAVSFAEPTGSYVHDLVAAAPAWYVVPILVIALAGALGQGVLCIYATGLDLEAIIPRLRRVQTTLATSVAAIALLYLGVFALDAVDSITAMTLILNALVAPWVAILVIGALRHRRTGYDPRDIQAFTEGRRGGRYWFTGGWNIPAVTAWAVGSIAGVVCVNSEPLYSGPLAGIAGGVDLSMAASALVASLLYLVLPRLATRRSTSRPPLKEEALA